ncbi:c-type cytochrome [Pseudoduganella aquatica]|uniref:C-type cytochrome n=1 Tax=Pseudoduganella aquatica TaxID=2660641 RepID=A0A7X4HF46_9BURK|nr:cytochrome c [Pseudoduganella aquatica]MYN10064.1 c-type cytochrome [Pseudoduganella aquatica]
MQLIRHCLTAAAFPVFIACAFSSAHAAEPIASGARLAATCTGCHGTNGATTGTALPPLAGQSREALLTSLQAFKSGARPATVMTQIAKGYSEEQLAMLAAYFAAQRPNTTVQGGRP